MNRFESGRIVWPILVEVAKIRGKITYMEIAKKIGYKGARPSKFPLWSIQDYCLEKDLPPLTILAINEETGEPGPGFFAWPRDRLQSGYERVYSYPWEDEEIPFSNEAIDHLLNTTPTSSADFEVKDRWVKSLGRGPYQSKFRNSLLDAYGSKCALCETRLSELLVAAHIIPWSIDEKNRLNPQNGILLCRTHDSLYEHGYISIKKNFEIDIECSITSLAGNDLLAFLNVSKRKKIDIPKKWAIPNKDFLDWRVSYSQEQRQSRIKAEQ